MGVSDDMVRIKREGVGRMDSFGDKKAVLRERRPSERIRSDSFVVAELLGAWVNEDMGWCNVASLKVESRPKKSRQRDRD